MNKQKIILGNSVDEMKKMTSETFDLIIADPPYNLGKNYGNNNDIKAFEEYLAFSKDWIREAYRLLKPTGTMYVFMGFRFISYLYNLLDRDFNMFFNSWIVWHYTQGIGKKKGFSPRHDDILMFTKTENFIFNLDNVRVPQKYYRDRNNMRGANPGDVWTFSHVHYCNKNRQPHPTQKPEGLIERMILASSCRGSVILDPFLGSGTTLRVCQQLYRTGVGIELNPDYVKMSKERLQRKFSGFDSIDLRMQRVPLDLNKESIRLKYIENHKNWFLNRHENVISDFDKSVDTLYQRKYEQSKQMHLDSCNKDKTGGLPNAKSK